MVIVAGVLEVAPSQREQFLESMADTMRLSRAEPGCLDYAFSADPLEPGRVLLFERWADKSSLAAHLERVRSQPSPARASARPGSATVVQYEIAAAGELGS